MREDDDLFVLIALLTNDPKDLEIEGDRLRVFKEIQSSTPNLKKAILSFCTVPDSLTKNLSPTMVAKFTEAVGKAHQRVPFIMSDNEVILAISGVTARLILGQNRKGGANA